MIALNWIKQTIPLINRLRKIVVSKHMPIIINDIGLGKLQQSTDLYSYQPLDMVNQNYK